MKRVYLVRHGQTVGNLERFFQFPGTELSAQGHEGGRAVAERFTDLQINQLVASPFTRAQQTAGYISEVIGLPVETVSDFHEKYHEESIRGVSHSDPQALEYKTRYAKEFWSENPPKDGAENFYDVVKRVESGIRFLEASDSENIIVVSHADFIRSMVTYLLLDKSDDAIISKTLFNNLHKMSNVGVTELLYVEGRWSLFHWNDHAHFAE